jgi:hypothetical protein
VRETKISFDSGSAAGVSGGLCCGRMTSHLAVDLFGAKPQVMCVIVVIDPHRLPHIEQRRSSTGLVWR